MMPWTSLPFHLLGAGGMLLAGAGCGLRILKNDSVEGPAEGALVGCALGMAVLCGGIFLVGVLGYLNPWVLGILFAGLGLWGMTPLLHQVRSILNRPNSVVGPWTVFEKILLFVIAAMVLSHFFYGYAPPTAEDELTYQITLPHLFAMAGKLVAMQDNLPSFYPLNNQLLYAAVLVFGNALSVKTLAWLIGMLVLAAIWVLARHRLAMSRTSSLVAVTLFVVMPYTTSLSGVTSSDFMGVFLELMTYYILFKSEPADLRRVTLAGVLGGLGMGTRPYASAWVIAMGILLCLKDRQWTRSFLFFLVAGLALSPWLLRNLVITGNPFYPKAMWPGAAEDPFFKLINAVYTSSFWEDLKHLPMMLISGQLIWGAGIPALALAPGSLADTPRRKEWLGVLFLCGLIITLTFGLPIRTARYFGQAFPFLALAGAAGFEALTSRVPRWASRAFHAWLLIALLVPNVIMSLYWGGRRLPYFLGRQSWEGYLENNYKIIEGYPMMQYIHSHLLPGSQIIVAGTVLCPAFYYPTLTMYSMPKLPPAVYNSTTSELAAQMRRRNIEYLLYIKSGFLQANGRSAMTYFPNNQLTMPPLALPFFEPLFDSSLSVLYKVTGRVK
jgi:hypothetical protein